MHGETIKNVSYLVINENNVLVPLISLNISHIKKVLIE